MKALLALLLWFVALPVFAAQSHLAGVMRQDSAGSHWYLIDTPGHTPVNIAYLSEESDGKLRVWYLVPASEVDAVSVTVDETYAQAGVTVGASVGLSYTDLSIYAPFSLQLIGTTPTWGSYITTTGNRFTIDTSTAMVDGCIKVTHPTMPSSTTQGPIVVISQVGSATTPVFVQSQTRNGFVLQAPPSFWLSGSRVLIQRLGPVRVRAQDVFTTTGNFWFLGLADLPP